MGKSEAMKLFFLIVMGIVLGGGLLMVGNNYLKTGKLFSVSEDGQTGDFKYSYEGKIAELKLQSKNKYTAAAVNPTFYVYADKPANWENGRQSVVDGYKSSYSSTSGEAVMSEVPGKYFVRAVLSGYYDLFFEVDVPAGGDVPLSQYNDGGEEVVKVDLIDVETLSVSNQDMGVATNETSDKTYHVFTNFNVDDNEGFCLDEVKFREDATYSFATDTDGDGEYDEGINKIVIKGMIPEATLFDVSGSINEFQGDDEAVIDVNKLLIEENKVLSMKFEVTCDKTLTTTGDADEKCGNGEDFLDSIILVDCSGNTASFDLFG